MSSNKIVLMSSDGETFTIDEAVAREFEVVAKMIEDDCADEAIPIHVATGKILALVIEYAKKRVEIVSTEEKEEEKKEKLEAWDSEFIKLDLDTIFEVLLVANFLNFKSLLELLIKAAGDIIRKKSVEEVREIFKKENDYTPEEYAEYREKEAWAYEPDTN